MTDLDVKKTKLKFEFQQFIVILVFVFGLGTAWSSLNSKQMQILEKLDVVAQFQIDMVASSDIKHSIIDKNFAYIIPNVERLMDKVFP